ncbi:uncharacterized protein LOC143629619 [Bidens hawaiensis]|uniref:uncharacterized protein LOC143629619 n=1 Tax=Bidens hawaiensis TaxID=980011 RepID=UPI00404A633C
MLNDKTSTPLNPPLVQVPHEDIIQAENEVLCERSLVTPGFEGDPSLKTSPVVSNIVDSCTRAKFSGVSSRRITRSMKTMDNTEILNNEAVSESGKSISNSSEDTVLNMESKDQNVDFVITEDTTNKDDADVNGESLINIEITDLEEKHITPKCSDTLNNTSVDVNDDNDLARTSTKGSRYKKKNRRQKEGAPPTQGISSKEAMMTHNRSKTKFPAKRKLITSPKSAKSTPARGKKGSEETFGSASILSIESFSGKKSRSGRVVLPPLEFWRNQKVVYDEDGKMCGVQQAK